MSKLRALVTGHTGFKGTWLVYMLSELGYEVIGLSKDKTADNLVDDQLRSRRLQREAIFNLTDFDATHRFLGEVKPDIVFHLAAQALVPIAAEKPKLTFEDNLLGTYSLLQAICKEEGITFLHVSTDKVYEPQASGVFVTENSPLGGREPYAVSKRLADELVSNLLGSSDSIHWGIARAGNVIGGGDISRLRLMPDIFRSLASGSQLEVRNPHATRPWQYVLDCLYGYVLFAERIKRGIETRVLNFGPDRQMHVDVLHFIRAVQLQRSHLRFKVSPAALEETIFLGLDSTSAREQLNWRVSTSFVETIEATVSWYEAFESGENPDHLYSLGVSSFLGRVC